MILLRSLSFLVVCLSVYAAVYSLLFILFRFCYFFLVCFRFVNFLVFFGLFLILSVAFCFVCPLFSFGFVFFSVSFFVFVLLFLVAPFKSKYVPKNLGNPTKKCIKILLLPSLHMYGGPAGRPPATRGRNSRFFVITKAKTIDFTTRSPRGAIYSSRLYGAT